MHVASASLALLAFALPFCAPPADVHLSENGRLEAGDKVLEEDDSLYDEYRIRAGVGYQLDIAMASPEFDTYVLLLDPEGQTVAQNDDITPGTDTNSRILWTTISAGEYTVIANGYSQGEAGSYNITIHSVRPQ